MRRENNDPLWEYLIGSIEVSPIVGSMTTLLLLWFANTHKNSPSAQTMVLCVSISMLVFPALAILQIVIIKIVGYLTRPFFRNR